MTTEKSVKVPQIRPQSEEWPRTRGVPVARSDRTNDDVGVVSQATERDGDENLPDRLRQRDREG